MLVPSSLVKLASSSDSVSKNEKFIGGISSKRLLPGSLTSDLSEVPITLEVGVVSGDESNKEVVESFA
jgi:hypothetical protein